MALSRFQQKHNRRNVADNIAARTVPQTRQPVPRHVKRQAYDIIRASRNTFGQVLGFGIGEFYHHGALVVVWFQGILPRQPVEVKINGLWVKLLHVPNNSSSPVERGKVRSGYRTLPSLPNRVPPGSWR